MNRGLYITIAAAAFLLFVLIMVPASLIPQLAGSQLQQVPGLTTGNYGGTIWQGSADIRYRAFPTARLDWDLNALPLATGTAQFQSDITGPGLSARLTGQVHRDGGLIDSLDANVASDYINAVTLPFGLDLTGEFRLHETRLAFDRRWLTDLAGKLDWTGGIVHIETPQQIYTVDLPPLEGQLSMVNSVVHLDVTGNGSELFYVRLQPDGWARLGVNRAFLDLSPIPLPAGTGDPVILMEERVFNTP